MRAIVHVCKIPVEQQRNLTLFVGFHSGTSEPDARNCGTLT
jgi:hypothetical protein